ncbi:MAG TPA: DUF4386 domain-containing protein [Gemmatimonadota bacterium]|nr:DUF4386 domain-containing protein [Gemmatimonadota bacterium]
MLTDRQTAVAVGTLFLTATATYLTADTLIGSALRRPDFLIAAAVDVVAMKTAALLALVCGIANVAIALLVYPLLKHHSLRLALGYVALRVGELGPLLLYLAAPLLLVALSEGLLDGSVDTSAANHLGLLLQALYAVSLRMVFLFTGMSGIVFAYLLYRTKLIPRPIAALGLIGYPLLIVGAILYMFHLIDFLQGVGLLFAWVVGLFELILPMWLIIRGFNKPAEQLPA